MTLYEFPNDRGSLVDAGGANIHRYVGQQRAQAAAYSCCCDIGLHGHPRYAGERLPQAVEDRAVELTSPCVRGTIACCSPPMMRSVLRRLSPEDFLPLI